MKYVQFITTHAEPSLTDDQYVPLETILRNLEIQRSWTFSDSTAGVVMRTMTRTIITTEISGIRNGYTTQMRAYAD